MTLISIVSAIILVACVTYLFFHVRLISLRSSADEELRFLRETLLEELHYKLALCEESSEINAVINWCAQVDEPALDELNEYLTYVQEHISKQRIPKEDALTIKEFETEVKEQTETLEEAVDAYNAYIQNFPGRIIAKLMNMDSIEII